jgi:hypothetical protein
LALKKTRRWLPLNLTFLKKTRALAAMWVMGYWLDQDQVDQDQGDAQHLDAISGMVA